MCGQVRGEMEDWHAGSIVLVLSKWVREASSKAGYLVQDLSFGISQLFKEGSQKRNQISDPSDKIRSQRTWS